MLGLPFHLMIAYSGVAIFVSSYMFGGIQAGYRGDMQKFWEEAGGFYERAETGRPLQHLHSIDALVADAQRRMQAPVDWASVHHPGDESAVTQFGTRHDRAVAWDMQIVSYDARDGRFLHQTPPPGAAYKTYAFLGGLHMVQFGGSTLRWLYFLLGLCGCVMLASGMQVWVRKRAANVARAGLLSGYGLVRGLNIGIVAGMPVACAALLWANRLLPAELAERADAEITVFCITWLLAAIWGVWAERRGHGWRDLFAISATALILLPVVNLLTTTRSHLLATVPRGEYALAAVDLTAVALGIGFALLAWNRRERRSPWRATKAEAAA